MRVTVIRDDGVIGINGVFRNADLSGMPEGVRAIQWNEDSGHVEYDDPQIPNLMFDTIEAVQSFIDIWNGAVLPTPNAPERISAAHARINAAYENAVRELTSGYPDREIASWDKQEAEARALYADTSALTPWIDGAAAARGIPRLNLAILIISNANALLPFHGALTGKRQKLRDAIDALGSEATQQQLDAIQW